MGHRAHLGDQTPFAGHSQKLHSIRVLWGCGRPKEIPLGNLQCLAGLFQNLAFYGELCSEFSFQKEGRRGKEALEPDIPKLHSRLFVLVLFLPPNAPFETESGRLRASGEAPRRGLLPSSFSFYPNSYSPIAGQG